jgi:hypothetical protein
MKRIYKEFVASQETSLPVTDEEGLQRVCSEKKLSYFSSEIKWISSGDTLNCSLVPLPQASFRFTIAFGMAKRSPYRRLFNYR